MSINTMKPSDKSSTVRRESIWQRVLWGLPLLGIFLAARTVLNTSISKWLPIVLEAARTGWVEDVGGRVPVNMAYTGIEGLDGFMRGPVSFFTPALAGLDHRTINPVPTLGQYGSLYAPQRLQTITFLADITCLNAIVAIESFRRGNSMIIALIPFVFGLAMQVLGGGQIVPLYLFLQYVFLPPGKFAIRDSRLVPTRYAKTLLPALIFGYIIPALGSFWPTISLETRQTWNFVWQFFPIWINLFHELLARCFKDVPEEQRGRRDVASDLVWLRGIYEFLFLLSASTYLYVFFVSPVPFSEIFFGDIWDWDKDVGSLTEGAWLFLKWDEIFVFLGTAVWILLCFRDLKREGRTGVGWVKVVVVLVGTGLAFGPGAGVAVMCAWREEVLGEIE